jgi:hypothetical protein
MSVLSAGSSCSVRSGGVSAFAGAEMLMADWKKEPSEPGGATDNGLGWDRP